ARRSLLHQEGRDAAVESLLRVGHGIEDYQVGDRAVRAERLLPVQAIAVAVRHGGGRHGEDIGTGLRLAHRVDADQRTVAELRQVAPLLLLRAEFPERDGAGQHERADGEDQAAILAAVAERLERQGRRERVQAAAAVLLRY